MRVARTDGRTATSRRRTSSGSNSMKVLRSSESSMTILPMSDVGTWLSSCDMRSARIKLGTSQNAERRPSRSYGGYRHGNQNGSGYGTLSIGPSCMAPGNSQPSAGARPTRLSTPPAVASRQVAAHILLVIGTVGSCKTLATEVLKNEFGYVEINKGEVTSQLLGVPPVPKTPRP